jgi:hypothetical protein
MLLLIRTATTLTEAQAAVVENQTTCSCQASSNDGIFGKDGIVIGLIVAGITAGGGVTVSQWFARRNHFLNPYKTWLIHLSGALTEYSEVCRCIRKDDKKTATVDCSPEIMNPVYLISHV